MATSVIGLKTHIWNNNLKSFLFVLTYPIIITPVYIAVIATLVSFLSQQGLMPRYFKPDTTFFDVLYYIVTHYWYVPYAIVFVYLLITYRMHMNRMDVPKEKQLVKRDINPKLYSMLENLCISRGLPTPFLFIRNSDVVNAYTSGLSNHTSYIVLTSGLLQTLNEHEVEAVLAHELTHIINRDTRLIFLTGLVCNMMSEMASMFHFLGGNIDRRRGNIYMLALYAIFKIASIGTLFSQLFMSRKREYMADAGAVELTKNPHAMISALRKIEKSVTTLDSNPIRKPLYIHYHSKSDWFSTHPSIQNRIDAIEMFSRIDTTPIEEKAPIVDVIKTADNSTPKDIW